MLEGWTLPQRHLVTELAVGLARRLILILGAFPDGDHVGPGYIFHGYTSEFETGCDVLWRLDVAYAAYGPEPGRKELPLQPIEKVFPPYFKLFAASEIRCRLSAAPPTSSPSLHELLIAYLRVACDCGPTGSSLPSRREPFTPQNEYAREIDALESLGYIERREAAVLWTNKIVDPMRDAYLWNADGQSIKAAEEAALEDECRVALSLTPEHTKRLLAIEAKRLSDFDFALLVRDRFNGLYWRINPDGTLRPQPGDIRLLRAVYRSLKSR